MKTDFIETRCHERFFTTTVTQRITHEQLVERRSGPKETFYSVNVKNPDPKKFFVLEVFVID